MQIPGLSEKKVLFFDFDGTLVDSMGMWTALNRRLLNESGVPEPPDFVARVTPLNEYDTADLFRQLGCRGTTEEIMRQIETMALKAYREEINLKPGARAFLEAMRSRGIQLAMITAALPSRTDACLSRLGLLSWFSMILNCDGYPKGKCGPEIYRDALRMKQVCVADTLYFEDNLLALRSAREAGLETVAVYDPVSEPYWNEIRRTATYTIRDFTEIEY